MPRRPDYRWLFLAAVAVYVFVLVLLGVDSARSERDVDCRPALTKVGGAHARAQRGWDHALATERKGPKRRVREQARCVPDGAPERAVRAHIAKAKRQLRAVDEVTGLSGSYAEFVHGVHDRTLVSLRVLGAWVLAEGGPTDNPLNIGPGNHYGSIDGAVDATVGLLRSSAYDHIPGAKRDGDAAQIAAIVNSSWCPGCAGYSGLIYGTYRRVGLE